MNKVYIDEIKDNFESFAIDIGINNIKRLEIGFVSQDSYIKGLISTITLHALENLIIFNDEQYENLIGICNTIRHD